MLKHRDFTYVGEPIPELNEQEHADFLMLVQESILLSLKDKKLLTDIQYERCVAELNEQHAKKQRKKRNK